MYSNVSLFSFVRRVTTSLMAGLGRLLSPVMHAHYGWSASSI